MRSWVIAVALVACKQDKPAPKAEPKPVVVPIAADAAPPPALAKCDSVELELASKILADAKHPCRDWIDATYGRVVQIGVAFSGVLVTSAPVRGAGWLLTCQHCTGPADQQGLHDLEKEDPATFQMRPPANLVGGKLVSGSETQLYFVHRLLSRKPPKSAFDAKGNLTNVIPADDFVVGIVSGTPVEVVGHIGAMPSAKVSDTKLALHDPKKLATAGWAEAATPGKRGLVLGFPRDIPDHAFGGELVASVGEILDDERAKAMLLKSDPDEAAIPYDPDVELVIAARASSGMSGGGAFDEDGRYLGVSVRGTVKPVDGKYLVRVVRMTYVANQLMVARRKATGVLGDKLEPFMHLPTQQPASH